jgi:glycosyltransferase involved in cell wall biosynthesis
MRVLIVTNMWPTPQRPAFGVFVRDQVEALRAIGAPDLHLELEVLPPGSYVRGAAALARSRRGQRFDVVHAHFGLTQWPALAVRAGARGVTLHGTDVRHPLSGRLTRAALRTADLVATVSEDLAAELPPPRRGQRRAVLPCGVATTRFTPRPRSEARERLGLDPDGRYLLFPADPERAGKRADRARLLAAATGATLLTAGAIDPEAMPWHVNAANAVVVPSDHEGFGLAVLEALACDVPVLATPTGIHPQALAGIDGTLCAPFDPDVWATTAGPHLAAADPRVAGRARAEEFGAARMAERVLAAWRDLAGEPLDSADAAS